jgi:glutamate racemase
MEREQRKHCPVGLLDSGAGLLPIMLECRKAMPYENYIALADLARLPYGTKSRDTVVRYTLQAAGLLAQEGVKLLTAACNTICSQAIEDLRRAYPAMKCIGVIETGAREAATVSATGHIAVLCTHGTARSGAYPAAIRQHRPDAQVAVLGCDLMVSLAEAGWHEGPEAEAIVSRYLSQLDKPYDTLVLACTHYLLMEKIIRRLAGPEIKIVNSAKTTARAVQLQLEADGLLNDRRDHVGTAKFLVTDSPDGFARIARPFLNGEELPEVEHIDIPNYDPGQFVAVNTSAAGSRRFEGVAS